VLVELDPFEPLDELFVELELLVLAEVETLELVDEALEEVELLALVELEALVLLEELTLLAHRMPPIGVIDPGSPSIRYAARIQNAGLCQSAPRNTLLPLVGQGEARLAQSLQDCPSPEYQFSS
jgi:hypothetical protein